MKIYLIKKEIKMQKVTTQNTNTHTPIDSIEHILNFK